MPRGASSRPYADELYEISADLLCALDESLRFVSANPALARFVGRDPEELLGERFVELVEPTARRHAKEVLTRAAEKGRSQRFAARFGDGEATGLVEWHVYRHPGTGALHLVGHDATEKLSAEHSHRELSSRHAAILAALPDIIAEVDLDKVYQWVNEAGREFFGADVVGRNAGEFFCDEDADAVYERVRPVFEGSEDTLYVETWQRRADGEKRLLGWWCRALKDEGGRVVGALSTARDITEARALGHSLRDSEHKIQTLFDNAAQGIVAVDREGRIRSFNAMAERQFGYSRDEIAGQPIETLLPRSLARSHQERRQAYFDSPRARPMGRGLDLMARRKDGTEFPVEISLSYIDSDQEPAAVAFVNDITERKRAEAERERLERHLEHATKMEAVGRLAGGIAHDFNNLLTALSGFSEIALDELPEDHPLYEGARETFKTCQRSASLVRRLLAVSRRQVLQPQVMDLNAKIGEIEKMLRSVLGEDIELAVRLAPDLGRVRADESQIEQVVLNLVVNARDAMPRGGKLVIETVPVDADDTLAVQTRAPAPGPLVLLSVSDTGCGMDKETLEHAFEPFFTTKEKGKGTGLGLATVYGIVRQSGGHIWAYSEPGRGTTFKIYLPRLGREGQAGEALPLAARDRRGSETVLVVEDENTVRLVATSNLRKAGYRVLEARGAEEALELVGAHGKEIDLVLTDVVMPRMNGPELVARIREALPGVKVLYMSGHADEALVHHGFDDARLSFLEKPFTRESLTRHVRAVLEAPATASESRTP